MKKKEKLCVLITAHARFKDTVASAQSRQNNRCKHKEDVNRMHHSAEPHAAKQLHSGQICLSLRKHTHATYSDFSCP